MAKSDLRWPQHVTRRANELRGNYDMNLKAIAAHLARHEQATAVDIPHVEQAHRALSALGLSRVHFLKRPSSESALGGLLLGIAWSIPDVLGLAINIDDEPGKAICIAAVLTCAAVGIFFGIHGLHRSSMPKR